MADPNADPFAAAFTAEGFASTYKRVLNPPTRSERLAALEADRAQVDAAKARALGGIFGTPVAETPEATAASQREQYRKQFESLSPEERKVASDALLDVEIDNDEITLTPVADEWEFADLAAWDEDEEEAS